MGYLVIYDDNFRPLEILGDKNDIQKYNKDMGFPHRIGKKIVTQSEIDEIDEAGE